MKKVLFMLIGLMALLSLSSFSVSANHNEHLIKLKTLNRINEYDGKIFKQAKLIKADRKNQKLLAKRIVSVGGMTRFQLTNGNYITANKRFVIMEN